MPNATIIFIAPKAILIIGKTANRMPPTGNKMCITVSMPASMNAPELFMPRKN